MTDGRGLSQEIVNNQIGMEVKFVLLALHCFSFELSNYLLLVWSCGCACGYSPVIIGVDQILLFMVWKKTSWLTLKYVRFDLQMFVFGSTKQFCGCPSYFCLSFHG